MSKELKQIKKNLKLSAHLHEYLLEHPKLLDDLPVGATIIFDRDTISPKDESTNLYQAIKKGKGWSLVPA